MKIFVSFLVSSIISLVAFDVNAQCTAKIGIKNVIQVAGAVVEGCDPLTISFNDNTTGGTSTRVWDFGDGTATSSSNNVTHDFAPGKKTDTIYTVTLTSSCLPTGSSTTNIKIKVLRRPNVDFSVSKTTVCQLTDNILFTNKSENNVGYINSWNFAGEGASALLNPNFVFQNDGLKYISLTVTDERGCFRIVTKPDYINVTKLPNPDFSLDKQVGCNPLAVTFGNITSEANITNWTWDFGDGSGKVNTKDLTTPHIYTVPNVITASLTAVNSLGCSNTTTKSIVNYFTPQAKFTLPSLVCKNASGVMSYNGLSNISTKYVWNIEADITKLSGSKSGPYNLKFSIPGTKSVKLTVTDTLTGCQDTSRNYIIVKDIPKLTLSSSEGDTICKASSVIFTALPAIYSNYVFKINKVTVQNSADNTYIAPLSLKNKDTLSVEIDNGCGGVENIPIVLTVKELPEVTLISSRDTIYKKTIVKFTAIPKNVTGYDKYEFYEGNVLRQSGTSNVWITDSLTDGKIVKVIVYNNGCTGNVSNKLVKVLDPFESPKVTAKTTTSSILISWNKVVNQIGENPDGYQISIDGGAFIDPSGGYGPNGTTHLISGLSPGDSVKVVVKTLATKLNNEDTLGNSFVSQIYTFYARACNDITFDVGPDLVLCSGDSATLFVKNITATNYNVYWNNTIVNKAESYTYLPKQSQNAVIQVIDLNQSNCVFKKYTKVTVKTKPVITLSVKPTGSLVKGEFITYTAKPASYDEYTFYNKGVQVQKSSVNTFATKDYVSGDVITAIADLKGCISQSSNAIFLKFTTKIDPVQINLDTATTSSVSVDWSPVEGATGYLVSINGAKYVVPNGVSINSLIAHNITGLSPGQKVDVLVKAFNDTDTSISSLFTAYALSCRGLAVNLESSPIQCAGVEAYVLITNTLPLYIETKWQNGLQGKSKVYNFTPLAKTDVRLDLIDIERPGCNVTKYYALDIDYSSVCNTVNPNGLSQVQVNLDTSTISSVTLNWATVAGATGYLVSVNGKTFVVPNGVNSGTELKHLISGLNPGEQVNVIVKAFNATDTTLSSVFTAYAQNCRGLDVNISGSTIVCTVDSAVVQVLSTLPNYINISWQGGSLTTNKNYKFKPIQTTNVQVDFVDIQNPKCIVSRNYLVKVDEKIPCTKTVSDKLGVVQINLDTATTSSVKVKWSTIVGATGNLISVNGASYVIPNGSNTGAEVSNLISSLSVGQKVDVLVKAFNDTDTTVSSLFTAYALSCRPVDVTLTGNSLICKSELATVQIQNSLPSYFQTKWQNGTTGTSLIYQFRPLVNTKVQVDIIDSQRSGCIVTRYFDVNINTTDVCNKNTNSTTTLDKVQINLDTATTSSVSVKWATVDNALGYLISVNGKTYQIPNGTSTLEEIKHKITGLNPGDKVDVIVKTFNGTDTTYSTVFTTYALNCRSVDANLVGTTNVCGSDSGIVQLTNTLPSYFDTKWMGGTQGKSTIYKFKPSQKLTSVKLELFDIERPGCIVTRYFTVEFENAIPCKTKTSSTLGQVQINLDTATISSVAVKWETIKDATGYLISVNGKSYIVPNGVNTAQEVAHLISGLSAGEKVDVYVKAFNSLDTTISTKFTTYALNCRGLDLKLTGTSEVCSDNTALVQISSTLPSYYRTKWQGGTQGTATFYTFNPDKDTDVKLELLDIERAGCIITRYYTVKINNNLDCETTNNNTVITIKKKLIAPDVSIDTSSINSVKIGWVPVTGATGYSISVNGSTFQTFKGSLIPDSKGHLTFTQTGLVPNETVTFVVKAFNGIDTVTSVIVNGVAISCSPLAYTLESNSPICTGDSAVISITSILPTNYEIKWATNSVSNARNYKFKPSVTTLVNVTVTNPTEPLCGLTKSILIKVNPIPVVTLTSSDADSTIYKGTPITFTANPTGLDGYEFYDRYSLVQNSTLSVYNTNALENNHKMTVIGVKDGCRSNASSGITTKVKEPLQSIQISGTSTNSSITITWNKINDAVKYQVSVNGSAFTNVSSGTTNNDTTHVITGLDPDVTTTIVIKAVTSDPNGFGSVISEPWTQTTIVCNAIGFKVTPDTTICEGSPVTLKLLSTNVAKYSLKWNYTTASKQTTYTTTPSKTVTLPVQLIDSSQINCPYYRYVKVTVNDRSALTLLASDTSYQICQGTVFTVNAQPSSLDNYVFKKGSTVLQSGGNPKLLVTNYNAGDTITVQGTYKTCSALNVAPYAKIVNPLPISTVDANVIGSACQGQDVIYSGIPVKNSAKYSFFESGILAQSSGNSSFTKTNVQPGALNPIRLSVKDLKTGCSSLLSTPKNITVLPYTQITSNSNASANTICAGESIKVTITPASLTKYQFFVNDTLKQESVINTFTSTNLKNGDKIKTVGVNSNNCSSPTIAPIAVVVKPIAQPNIIKDTINVCEGTNAKIKAVIPAGLTPTLLWETSGETNVDSISRLYTTDTKVKIKATLNGCIARDSVLVKVYKLATSSSNLVSNSICDGYNAVFTVLPNNLSKYKFYVNGVLKQESDINTFTKNNLKNGDKVTSEVVNSAYCANPSNSDVTVTVNPIIKPNIKLDTMKVCSGVIAKIKATIPSGKPTLTWNSGETGSDSLTKTFTDNFLQILTATANGCSASDSVYILVDKVKPPVLEIDMIDGHKENGNWVLCRYEAAKFNVKGSVLGKYEWFDPSWNLLSTLNEVTVSPNSTITYAVIGYNMACKDTAKVKLEIVSCGTTTQIITPGGDGKNDRWIALEPEEYFKNNTVTIFNRWGNQVYNVTNYKNDWEGTNQDGDKLPEGTYYYVIKVEGNANAKVGFIMIKR